MVLFERAIIELSSLTASVTLQSQYGFFVSLRGDLHQRVWLLLLLEDGSCGLVVLWRISKGGLRRVFGSAYILGLSAIGVPGVLLVAVADMRLVAMHVLGKIHLRLGVVWFSGHLADVSLWNAATVLFRCKEGRRDLQRGGRGCGWGGG